MQGVVWVTTTIHCHFIFDFSMSSGSKRRANRNWRRDERRLQAYLHMCVICFGADQTSPYPSSQLPCCRQFCHEHCLLRWFESSRTPGPVQGCPHCRSGLLTVNRTDRVPSATAAHTFSFRYIPYPSPYGFVNLDRAPPTASDSDDLFLNPPIPPPPPGWAALRRAYPAFSSDFS